MAVCEYADYFGLFPLLLGLGKDLPLGARTRGLVVLVIAIMRMIRY
jgi:hypothetical protein